MLLYIFWASLSSFHCLSQRNQASSQEKKTETSKTNAVTVKEEIPKATRKIKYYHVEEIVSLKFGGHKTVYDVVNPKIINDYDLGPNGSRTITPVYEDMDEIHEITIIQDTLLKNKNQSKIVSTDAPKKSGSHAYIDILKTYERVADKGYESIEMLKKMGDSYFFNDEIEKAEKCYDKLFSITTNLEPDYYYRYSIVLKMMGNNQKSDEFLKKFNQLSSISAR